MTGRYVVVAALAASLTLCLLVVVAQGEGGGTMPTTTKPGAAPPPTHTRTVTVRVDRGAARALERARARLRVEHARYLAVHRRVRQLARTLLERPSVREAITLACIVFGSCETLWRRARCETGGTFSPTAYNPSGASGLFQFMRTTWATTPFAALSIWSPYANALAAGWMQAHGRGGEWACR